MRLANVLQLGFKELHGLGRDTVLLFLVGWCFSVAVYEQAICRSGTAQ